MIFSTCDNCRSTSNVAIIVLQVEHATSYCRLVGDLNSGFKYLVTSLQTSYGLLTFLILLWQERSLENEKFSFTIYLCYLIYAPLYIAGPIVSFNAFASQVIMICSYNFPCLRLYNCAVDTLLRC